MAFFKLGPTELRLLLACGHRRALLPAAGRACRAPAPAVRRRRRRGGRRPRRSCSSSRRSRNTRTLYKAEPLPVARRRRARRDRGAPELHGPPLPPLQRGGRARHRRAGGVLWLLAGPLRVHYLVATAVAIEVSVLHNFVWHLRWTWAPPDAEDAAPACLLPLRGVPCRQRPRVDARQPRPDAGVRRPPAAALRRRQPGGDRLHGRCSISSSANA